MTVQNRLRYHELISIIVPVYNVEGYLDKCIDSITSQSYSNFECLLIDDGSTDSSGDICDKWSSIDDRITVYHKENGGLSDARNYGIDRAKGDYITFIDSDDYVSTNYLSELYMAIKSCVDCSMAGCGYYVVSRRREWTESYNPNSRNKYIEYTSRDAIESVLYNELVCVSAWGKLYKKEIFESLRFPVRKLYEDTYIIADTILKSKKYIHVNKPLYFYIKRSGSIVSGNYSSSRLQFIESVERMTGIVQSIYPNLKTSCVRRKVHARLSVLRYMEKVSDDDRSQRDLLRFEALKDARSVLRNTRAPARDKVALILLWIGYVPFYLAWNLYSEIKK